MVGRRVGVLRNAYLLPYLLKGGEIMGIIIGSWLGLCMSLSPDSSIFLIGLLFIHLTNTVYKDVKRSWNQNEK